MGAGCVQVTVSHNLISGLASERRRWTDHHLPLGTWQPYCSLTDEKEYAPMALPRCRVLFILSAGFRTVQLWTPHALSECHFSQAKEIARMTSARPAFLEDLFHVKPLPPLRLMVCPGQVIKSAAIDRIRTRTPEITQIMLWIINHQTTGETKREVERLVGSPNR